MTAVDTLRPRPGPSPGAGPRHTFRAHPLDGAMLYFHPATGTHVRVETAATRALQRQAPRVAMFGITNHCNLQCGFCSRDTDRPSAWTVASAAEVLRGLAAAGTLEVAFGGGEPFAFRGFAELVAELHATTTLALNVTTNGTLIRGDRFGAYAGRFGQVRVSLYEDNPWREAGEGLSDHGQRWGANVLVDDALLPRLPALLGELAQRGCADVSLLSYVGPDPHRHLSPQGRTQLAAVIADSPLPCRVSVCLGNSLPVPRLFDGPGHDGDCGAGRDFVSITPDQRLQACSFQDGGLPATSAAEILQAWRTAQARLRAPSLRRGCARQGPRPPAALRAASHAALPPVAVWQGFSGNNSGECIMVAKFQTVQDAEAYLAQLLPHWQPDTHCPPEWKKLFAEVGVAASDELMDATPAELLSLGRTVIATSYAADDSLSALRALAWQQGAEVIPGGVHLHDGAALLAAVRARDTAEAQALASRPPHPAAETFVHGDVVLVAWAWGAGDPPGRPESLAEARDVLTAWSTHRPMAAEVLFDPAERAAFTDVLKHLGAELPRTPRLVVQFWGPQRSEQAARYAQDVTEAEAIVAGGCVLVTGRVRWKRLVLQAYRLEGHVNLLDDHEVIIRAGWSVAMDTREDATALQGQLQSGLPQGTAVSVSAPTGRPRSARVSLTLKGQDPVEILPRVIALAPAQPDAYLWLSITEAQPLAFAVRRVLQEVRQARG